MKWFKHSTNSSVSDPIVSLLQEKYGGAGYSMYFKLIEVIAGNLQYKEQESSVRLSIKMWAKHLMCRKPKLVDFFQTLEEEGHIFFEMDDDFIDVTMPSIKESLDNKAISSSLRRTTGFLEKKNKVLEKKKNRKEEQGPEEDKSPFFLTEKNLNRFKSAISNTGSDAINSIIDVVDEVFSTIGKNDEAFNHVCKLIDQQFGKSEKSKALGASVMSAAKNTYRRTVNKIQAEEREIRKKKKRKAAKEIEKLSPNKTDQRCMKVLEQLEADHNLELHEISIDPSDLRYFIKQNEGHYGKEKVFSLYSEIVSFLAELDCNDMASECLH
jgi:hypothetical protein